MQRRQERGQESEKEREGDESECASWAYFWEDKRASSAAGHKA